MRKVQKELEEKREEEVKMQEMRERYLEAQSKKDVKSIGISCGILDNEQLSLFMLDSLAYNTTLRKLIEAKRKFEIVPEEQLNSTSHIGGLKIKEKPEPLPKRSREEVRKIARELVDKLGLNKGPVVTGKYA